MIYVKNSFNIICKTLDLKTVTVANLLCLTDEEIDAWRRADMVPRRHTPTVKRFVRACKYLQEQDIQCPHKLGYIEIQNRITILHLIILGMDEIEASNMLIATIKKDDYSPQLTRRTS